MNVNKEPAQKVTTERKYVIEVDEPEEIMFNGNRLLPEHSLYCASIQRAVLDFAFFEHYYQKLFDRSPITKDKYRQRQLEIEWKEVTDYLFSNRTDYLNLKSISNQLPVDSAFFVEDVRRKAINLRNKFIVQFIASNSEIDTIKDRVDSYWKVRFVF